MLGPWSKKWKVTAAAGAALVLSVVGLGVFPARRVEDATPGVSHVKTESLQKNAKASAVSFRRQKPSTASADGRRCGGTNEAAIMSFKLRSLPRGLRPTHDCERPLSAKDQELCRRISAGYEANDFTAVKALVPEAKSSPSADVREEMVWALDWFGEKALPEIVGFMSDPDDEVAQDAFNAWESALAEIEDENRRLYVVEYVLRTGAPKDMLESVALEYVGMGDRAAVESLVRLIEGRAPGAEQALDRYESITGETYTTPDAARKWLDEFAAE